MLEKAKVLEKDKKKKLEAEKNIKAAKEILEHRDNLRKLDYEILIKAKDPTIKKSDVTKCKIDTLRKQWNEKYKTMPFSTLRWTEDNEKELKTMSDANINDMSLTNVYQKGMEQKCIFLQDQFSFLPRDYASELIARFFAKKLSEADRNELLD